MNMQPTEITVYPAPQQLTDRHLAILCFIHAYTAQYAYAPNMREIASAIGITSTSMVDYYLSYLSRKHYLKRTPGKSRSVLLLEAGFRAIGQPTPHELQAELARLLVENRRLHEQCEQLKRERDRLLTAPSSLPLAVSGH